MQLPSRVVHAEEARARFGDLLDRLTPWLLVEDPLADAVVAEIGGRWEVFRRALEGGTDASTPPSVRALLEAHSHVPLWVDGARADRGGRLFFRSGLVGAVVLGARSLVSGYCSPAGNKPLAMTGTLEKAGARRLAETGRYVAAVSSPGGLLPGAEGWRISLRVRLMHAHVRRLLHRSGRWRTSDWGAPINQHDMLATSLLFSAVWVDGVRRLGVGVTIAEAEDHLHLWRWASWLMGVRLELLPDTEARAQELMALIEATQGDPDDDARRLAARLLQPPEGGGRGARPVALELAQGLCYGLLPRRWADGLGLPRTPWRHAVSLSRLAVAPAELARRVSPAFEDQMVRFGVRHWEQAVASGLRGGSPAYQPPTGLAEH